MCGMPQHPPVRSTPTRPPRPDASMSLLNNVMDHSLDDGYAEAAARKQAADGGLPKTLRAKLGLAAGLVLAALVVTVGAAQARVEAPVVAKEREELIDRINEETAAADRLEDTVDELRDDVSARQREALKASGGNERGELVGVLAGAVEVHGPGVKLVVNDAKASGSGGEGDPRQSSGFSDTGRVRDRDMQRVVNGLWESGAEAISINGQRLTALSAIRAAGDAILVDNKPLVPPYTVLAVGDGEGLSRRFQASADGLYLDALKENFGIRTTLSVEGELKLPAAPSVTVRTAQPNTENTEKGTS
ncbi:MULTISPECIES: DUF881 domain-containing protein [unclassified Streptomyces]|uniref:DUF881 domain-containing protein n=1 Tax=Streptomyces sp. NBRC 14336 TaxID=3030992 RepID=UPI0025574BAB|nr:DUF881 domain-containing protein [Streptomyces sp. NBRC 14336]WBO76709.1 DUF881 domain-containing protein [Streptomyces sp. SBE_14.2]